MPVNFGNISKSLKMLIITIIIIVVTFFLILILGPFYTLKETECAVITRFGKPKKSVTNSGLHLKLPFIDKVNILPKVILEWDGEVRQFPTYDKRMIMVDTMVRWKIKDPLLFFESLSTVANAIIKLDDILDAASRQVVSQHTFESIIRDSNRIIELDEKTIKLLLEQGFTREDLKFPTIQIGRSELAKEMKKIVIDDLANMGIEVINFYIKKINYIDENLNSVYESMIAERKKIAQSYRSEGENYREKKLGEIEQKTKEIMAKAQEESRRIMGEAEAEAARIYNNAYNRNASTREFYEFLKKMEMYKKIPNNSSLIISTDSEFFNMFKKY
ncbi:MAG TPA: protease modulator HflC [Spirochaetota bacterium]|nr:protease modulator HflC [Spirochaetota bacterium]